MLRGAAAGAAVVGAELIDPERVAASDDQRRRAQTRAHDLALSLEAHFVSVGQHETATLYETVADELDASIAQHSAITDRFAGTEQIVGGIALSVVTNSLSDAPWWKTATVYQIYPRSFCDTTGNGVGDIAGIIAHLDHLEWLGIDAIWLSPVFTSPMVDHGYDVADYCDIDPIFGDLEAFDRLVAEAHARNIRVVLDWVPNHTSDQHPWFVESRSSIDSPTRDWYVWREGDPDTPPNNWQAALLEGPGLDLGRADRRRGISTCSPRTSPTSTGRTTRSAMRCSTRCGSGSIAGSTDSGWTWCISSPNRMGSRTGRRGRDR